MIFLGNSNQTLIDVKFWLLISYYYINYKSGAKSYINSGLVFEFNNQLVLPLIFSLYIL